MSQAKSFPITVHLTDEAGAAVQGLAGLDEKSASEWVRDLVMERLDERTAYAQRLSRILLGRKEPGERTLFDSRMTNHKE